ncbi:MAG: GreA/GreB family elongation factor [Candidatus Pacebacteria bacterium]|jgi:transcription elongation factor GreA|nr:GreA/GreB family elongation factor [Candidatus Paceibacterota bacterium]
MPNAKFFLSRDGFSRIKEELDHLRIVRLQKSAQDSPKMTVSTDVNPEYLAYYEDITLLEARMKNLDEILRNAVLIKPPGSEERDTVQPGAQVIVENSGKESRFTITGSAEADPAAGKISADSPVGAALLGHRAGERISVPAVKAAYRILGVNYRMA